MSSSMGKVFRSLVETLPPLPIVGTINAYSALLAERAGCLAIYLSGAGVANSAFGLPDLAMTTLSEVVEEARRITEVSSLPLLVDVDTGFGHAFSIARTVKLMERAGVAAIHIEDQIQAKRCGHRPNKAVVSVSEMQNRLKSATDVRTDADFVIMARTDACAVEGLNGAIERALQYVEAGADMIFAEALGSLEAYTAFANALKVPVLANLTEFGKTPLFTREEMATTGVGMLLYPLSAFRAMSQIALEVYQAIVEEGTQKRFVNQMQTRDTLYDVLEYERYEKMLDELQEKQDGGC